MKLRHGVGIASALVFSLIACGGATPTEFFGDPGTSEFGTDPAPGPSSDVGPCSGSGGAALPPPTNNKNQGSSSGTGSKGDDDGPQDPSDPPDPPNPDASIACGDGNTCDGSEFCCATWSPNKKEFSLECHEAHPGPNAGCAGVAIRCDDREDCPNSEVCCGVLGGSGYANVGCRASCDAPPGKQAVRFCSPDAATDECAEIGKTCSESQSLPGYWVCK